MTSSIPSASMPRVVRRAGIASRCSCEGAERSSVAPSSCRCRQHLGQANQVERRAREDQEPIDLREASSVMPEMWTNTMMRRARYMSDWTRVPMPASAFRSWPVSSPNLLAQVSPVRRTQTKGSAGRFGKSNQLEILNAQLADDSGSRKSLDLTLMAPAVICVVLAGASDLRMAVVRVCPPRVEVTELQGFHLSAAGEIHS
jgi:hypothetical protein